jgi:hypothetical protein
LRWRRIESFDFGFWVLGFLFFSFLGSSSSSCVKKKNRRRRRRRRRHHHRVFVGHITTTDRA